MKLNAAPNAVSLARLNRLQGPAFDRQFLAVVTHRHEVSLKAMEHQRFLLAKGSPVLDLLSQQLPLCRAHYDIASNLTQKTLQMADASSVFF